MKKILISLVVLLALVGCSSKPSTDLIKTVCTNDSPYLAYESGQQNYTSKGDKVLSMDVKAVLELGDAETLAVVMDTVDEIMADYEGIEGLSVSVEKRSETSLYDIIEVDFEKADLTELAQMNIVDVEVDAAVKYVSLKKTIATIEAEGFSCATVK